ncbi:MAG TPA: YegS/Rv2252/BmrU family lipid kinase [Candidatus Saccharimonadales bacterium]|nr:YegS/Rv2252/BmrU family lipid kinase [Candidatus Saccharimonadales bacterium]
MKSKQQLEQAIRKHKRAVLLVNAKSRKGAALFKTAKALLLEQGITLDAAYAIRDMRLMDATIQKALSHNPELLVVGSGDGTLATVVDHLAYCDTVVAFIPLGTTNNFARTLGIPLTIEGAVDVITHGKVADIDLGKVNDDYFTNVTSLGISVAISSTVSHRLKKRIGRLAYVIAGARALLNHRAFHATVVTEHKAYEFDTHQIIVANGRFHGGTLIAEDASVDSHELVVFHLGDHRRWQLLVTLLKFGFKRRRTLQDGNFIVTKKARIITHPKRRVEIDGEVSLATPIDISIAPNALRMLVPQDFEDD